MSLVKRSLGYVENVECKDESTYLKRRDSEDVGSRSGLVRIDCQTLFHEQEI